MVSMIMDSYASFILSSIALVLLFLVEFFTIAWHTTRGHSKTVAMRFFVCQQTAIVLVPLLVARYSMWHNQLMAILATATAIVGILATQWAWKNFGNPEVHYGKRFDPWHVKGSFPSHYPLAVVLVAAMTPHHLVAGSIYLGLAAILSAAPWLLFRNPDWKAPGWCPGFIWEWFRVWKKDRPIFNPFRVRR